MIDRTCGYLMPTNPRMARDPRFHQGGRKICGVPATWIYVELPFCHRHMLAWRRMYTDVDGNGRWLKRL